MKHIFVTGGVVSGLGKGITAASLGRLLKARGLKVSAQKLDPYMNVDPGNINPMQHGEVFVTADGFETDLDLGHYERFIDEELNKYSSTSSGRIYFSVLNKELKGEYNGKTVQIIPHITDEIKNFIYNSGKESKAEILITEIGGTVGDIESQPFLETARQISLEKGKENCLFVHVVLVPFIPGSNEYKSKPAQHSVRTLQSYGINPDIIVTRAEGRLDEDLLSKIALFCNVKRDQVIENATLKCLYEAPTMLSKTGLDEVVCRQLNVKSKKPDLASWEKMLKKVEARNGSIKIALVGKYVSLPDAYISVVEALSHAGYEVGKFIDIKWVDSNTVTKENVNDLLKDVKGIIVPDGVGSGGTEGMIEAIRFARENNVPFLGICMGMQLAVIEYAQNAAAIKNASSGEFEIKNSLNVIDLLQSESGKPSGELRLGNYECKIKENTLLAKCYGKTSILERHRNKYEFNNEYKEILTKAGLTVSGENPDKNLVEAVEITKNKFFIGVQFRPEFKSRPNKAHPLFLGFIRASNS